MTTAIERKRPAVELVKSGKGLVPADRQFHADTAANYIVNHGGRERWVLIGELARTFFMRDSKSNRIRMRQRMHLIFHLLLNRGFFLVYDFDGQSIRACKIHDPRSQEERQYIQARFNRMQKHVQLKADELQKAWALIQCE